MSGGALDYFYNQFDDHVGDFGDRELDDLVKDMGHLFYAREWYLSGDTSEGSWNEARDEFKAKWFGENSRTERIEQYLEDIKTEVMQSFGVNTKYCKDCGNWIPKSDGVYGECTSSDTDSYCLYHRCHSCKSWVTKNG